MPSTVELRVEQKRRLFQLKKLGKAAPDLKELKNLIIEVEAEMEEEDVAWVEKKVKELE